VRADAAAFASAGLELRVANFDPVLLPLSGVHVYRRLRRLLAEARTRAAGGPLKIAVLDIAGKSHVEVTVRVPENGASRVLSCAFPRHDAALLGGGFAETVETS
jgi:hypothetical protein